MAKKKLPEGLYRRAGTKKIWCKVRQWDEAKRAKVPVCKSCETEEVAEAVRFRDCLRAQAHAGKAGPSQEVTLEAAFKLELKRARRECQPKQAKALERDFERLFFPFFGRERKLASIGSAHLGDFVEHLLAQKYEKATCNLKLARLSGAFKGAHEAVPSLLEKVPKFPFFPARKLTVRTGFLSWSEYARLQAFCPPSVRALVTLLYHVGFRLGEALALRWDEHVSFSSEPGRPGLLRLDGRMTKSGKARACPLYGDLAHCLRAQAAVRAAECPDCPWVCFWHASDAALFKRARTGSAITQNALWRVWKKAAKDFGQPDLLLHDMRRSAATNLVERADMSEGMAMEITGHKTRAIFERYHIVRGSHLEATWQKLEKMYERETGAKETVSVLQ